ncbi:MAG: DUF3006 domain-containing protein [Clostridia bacterium]|nr:DUF3006 domain-containing protein [Clostridia bacterium]
MKVTVYDIEGGIAVIELANGKLQNILKALLPYGVKIGDVIDIESGMVTEGEYEYQGVCEE